MKNNYKVSVIIPVFNAEKYICKSTVSAVSLKEVGEVLLIEDGSTDNSLSLCRELSKTYDKVRLLTHKDGVNIGAGASRNLGIENAKYEFIAFLDADDYYLSHRFVREIEVFSEYPDADGVYGCNQEIFKTERAREFFFAQRSSEITTLTEKVAPEKLYRCLLFGGYGEFHTSTITLRKRAFQKAGLFNPAIRYVEDTELWLKLAVSCRLYPGSIDEPQTVRIVHETNSIHEWDKIKPYKDMLYQSVFDWILKQDVAYSVKNDFFTALYYHFQDRYTNAAALLWKQLRRNPAMIFSSFLYKKIYLLLRS